MVWRELGALWAPRRRIEWLCRRPSCLALGSLTSDIAAHQTQLPSHTPEKDGAGSTTGAGRKVPALTIVGAVSSTLRGAHFAVSEAHRKAAI